MKLITVSFWYDKYELPLYLSCFRCAGFWVGGYQSKYIRKYPFQLFAKSILCLVCLPYWLSSDSPRSLAGSQTLGDLPFPRLEGSESNFLSSFTSKLSEEKEKSERKHITLTKATFMFFNLKKCLLKSQQTLYKNITFSNVQQSLKSLLLSTCFTIYYKSFLWHTIQS